MESTPEQAAEGLVIVRVLAAVLDRLIYANAATCRNNPDTMLSVTKFHAMKPPGISIQQYLERIHRYASCSNECFILALIYIDRLIQRNNFLLSELNVHRVAITSVLLAAKFFDDAYYNNAYYAKVGGVLVHEMNGLEVDFLFRINFSLYASSEEFTKYRNELLSHSGMTVPSNSISNISSFDNQNNGMTNDTSASPPPAQVSPEIHFSTTPSDMGTSNDHDEMYMQRPNTPPTTVPFTRDPNMVMIVVPPENEVSVYQHQEYAIEKQQSEPSYYGFPLHPQPTFHPPPTRRNSMPLVVPQEAIPYTHSSTASNNTSMPLSDPIRSIQSRYNNSTASAAVNYIQPIRCMPQFPTYHSDSIIDTASTSSVVTVTSASTLHSNNNVPTSSSYYTGKVIVMDHDQRIQQPLHLWDGTPITVVQHHHHGAVNGNMMNGATSNVCYHNISNHHQQHPQQQQVHVVAMSGVGGL